MNISDNISILIEGFDLKDPDVLIQKCIELRKIKKELNDLDENLKVKLKIFLKEKQWEKYVDKKNNISVSLIQQKRESIDKEKLKMFLTDSEIAQVKKIDTFEKMLIITPEDRRRLKNYGKKKP